jgi:very-short-patch-repair endonuclease
MWNDFAGLPPFRRRDAPRFGLTDADVRRLLDHGVLIRLAHGLLAGYRRSELAIEDPAQVALRAQAMQRRYPGAVVGLRTAAALQRLWLVGPIGPTQLLRPRGYPRTKHDVTVESTPLPPGHLGVAEGVLVTTMARTVVDLADRLPGGEALAVADSALRLGAKPQDMKRIAAELGHDPDGQVARVLRQASPLSQSALESMSRWLFYVRHVATPELQVTFEDNDGPFAIVDFLWRAAHVVGEADGLLKYDDSREALRAEKIRQERLEALGLIVVRWSFSDITDHPALTVSRVRAALARGAANQRRSA